jgi:lipopolysaccharide export system protein LptC
MTADRIRVWLGVALLALLMLGSFWAYEVMRRNSEDRANGSKVRSEPDYFVEDFNFVRLSQSGNTNYRVTGEKLTHFPQEDEFEILQPRIVSIDEDKTPMLIRADRAIVKQKVKESANAKPEDQIHMMDNVVIERAKSARTAAIIMETSSLILYPDSEKMKTDARVKMTTLRAMISAYGMEANNTDQKVHFLKNVHIEIENKIENRIENKVVSKVGK